MRCHGVTAFPPGNPQHRRPALLIALGLGLFAAAIGCSETPAPVTTTEPCKRPNVVLYIMDTLRADDLGRYSEAAIETPAADRLAREGALFETVYAPSSWTRASIGSIMTGLYPDVHGAQGRNDALPAHLTTLAESFQQHGYETGAVVANPNIGAFYGFDQGYDDFLQLFERRDVGMIGSHEALVPSNQVTDHVLEWIDSAS